MALIDWNPRFELGVESVDRDHRELIELINALHAAMCAGATHDRIVAGLGRIHTQIAAHFALEEKLMREANYPGFDDHKLDHDTLLEEIIEIRDSVAADGDYVQQELSLSLDRWFSDHVHTFDAKLHGRLGR